MPNDADDTVLMLSRAQDEADRECRPDSMWAGGAKQSEWDYAFLRALIVDAFNPPDRDEAETAILGDALAWAFEYIRADDCECKPSAEPTDPDVCSRCQVLGRVFDVRVDR